MRNVEVIVRGLRFLVTLSVLLAGSSLAQSVSAPQIDVWGIGSYTVSYSPCTQCLSHGLEEYQSATGTWQFAGTGQQTFTNRGAGTYRYRVVYVVTVGRATPLPVDGPEAAVMVEQDGRIAPSAPPPLTTQLDAEYSISRGDVDGDGRQDLLIRRSTGSPASGAGTVADVLLRQTAAGTLEAALPSDYLTSVASGWPEVPVEIGKRDVNIDGYVDLVLRGIDSADGFAGVSNQILLAPGSSGSRAPDLLGVDPALSRFSQDLDRHLIDPDYYPNHAPVNYAPVYYYAWNCGWPGYPSGLEGWFLSQCFLDPVYYYVAYQDYSGFDQNAIAIANIDYGMIHGYEPLDSGLERIAALIARVLGSEIGGWDLGKLLGGTGTDTDDATRRGIELFAVLAGISEAVAQEAEESPGQPGQPDRVLLKGRRVLGQGPFHTALEYQYSTVSAYDSNPSALFDGLLISEVNWPRDHPMLTLRLGYVDGPTPPVVYWGSILQADSRYEDDLRYDLFPSLGRGGYNSNSFVSGLIPATLGQPTVQMTSFVGGERPVPASAFN